MAYNWQNDSNLSHMSNDDYNVQIILHLTSVIDTDPTDKSARFARGNAYLDREQFEEAIADYTAVIALAPDDAIAYNNRGIAYRSQGKPALAIVDYDRAIELDPDYRDAYNNLGLARSDEVRLTGENSLVRSLLRNST